MEKENQAKLIKEIRLEQRISPLVPDTMFENFVKEGIQDINETAGAIIDYDVDLVARSLLKTYVRYANHARLHEFKGAYVGEYTELQIKYFNTSNIS